MLFDPGGVGMSLENCKYFEVKRIVCLFFKRLEVYGENFASCFFYPNNK